MRVACLFSGGRDSALTALLLEPFCELTLVTASGGRSDRDPAAIAAPAADALDLPHRALAVDAGVYERAVATMHADGYPRNGIQSVHEHVLETVADEPGVEAVADGTRRDDRVPRLDRAAARSLEDRHGVEYLRPLAGLSRAAIDRMAEASLEVERGPSERLATGDYEAELRALLAAEHGAARVEAVFPAHEQSRVTGRRG